MPRDHHNRHWGGVGIAVIDPLVADIAAWLNTSTLVHLAGMPQASWSDVTYIGQARTYILPNYACRRNSIIKRAVIHAHTAPDPWTIRLYRYSGGLYTMVPGSERSIQPAGGDVVSTVDIDPGIGCRVGDFIGVYMPTGNRVWEDVATPYFPKRYEAGDVTSGAFAGIDGGTMHMDFFGPPAYWAITGDSISEGTQGDTWWYSYLHNANPVDAIVKGYPGGNYTAEIWHRVSDMIGNNQYMSWQNAALISQKFDWGVTTGVPEALAAKPKVLTVAFGINDILASVTWATTLGRLNTIKGLFDASISKRMILCGILPVTGFTDVIATTIRTWNTNMEAWALANNVRFFNIHDAMGAIRATTGYYDNLNPAYDRGDGVHLSVEGVLAYAELFKPVLYEFV